MAHYIFQRNNGYGDFDFIASFETMELTDYPEYAVQIDDDYIGYIDMPYLNQLGFFPVGITSYGLRINPMNQFRPGLRGYRPIRLPGLPRLRGAAPRPMPGRPVPPPRPMHPQPPVPPRGPAPRVERPLPGRPAPVAPAPARPVAPAAPARPVAPAAPARPAAPVVPGKPGDKGPGGRGPGGMGPGRR